MIQPLAGGLAPLGVARARAAAGNGLLNNLIAYWPLNEAAGANDALDLHSNGLTLTQNSSPGSAAGKVYAGARTFDGRADYFSRASEALLQTGDVDFTFAAWVYLTGAGGLVFGKDNNSPDREYYLYADASVTQFVVFKTGPAEMPVAGAGVTANTWALVFAWHDAGNNLVGIQIDNGTPATAATTAAAISTAAAFQVSARSYAASRAFWPGRVGPVAMWKSAAGGGGVLSEAQRLALWNGGAGLAYAGFTA